MFHKWISQDDNYVSCLTCGYLGEDTDPDDIASAIVGAGGETPTDCTSTSSVHGYPGERYCHTCEVSDDELYGPGPACEHIRETDDCNCLQCA